LGQTPASASEPGETPQESIRPKASVVLLDEWESKIPDGNAQNNRTRTAESTKLREPETVTGVAGQNRELTRIQLPAQPDIERTAALLADRIAQGAGFSAADVGRIRTAVLEGVLNAIEHSFDAEKSIDVQLLVTPEGLEISIENEGDPFDPLAVQDPDPHKKVRAENKRGWGIALMKRFMDEVSYQTVPHGTRLRMLKRRTQDGSDQNKSPIEVVKQIKTAGDSIGGI
jgi:serine/threonine-protein kinase RsbW